MAGEYDKQFEQLTQLIKETAESADVRFEELTHLVKKTDGRVDELRLEVRDLRMEVGAVRTGLNDKIDSLLAEIAKVVVDNTRRIQSLEGRVDVLEGQAH
jgi:hypothetical protein